MGIYNFLSLSQPRVAQLVKNLPTMQYHLTPARLTSIKKSTNNKCWRGCGGKEKEEPSYTVWECNLVQPLWKTVWRSLKERKTELPYKPQPHPWAYIQRKL